MYRVFCHPEWLAGFCPSNLSQSSSDSCDMQPTNSRLLHQFYHPIFNICYSQMNKPKANTQKHVLTNPCKSPKSIHPLKLTVRTWKWMIGILSRFLLGFGPFSGAFWLVFGRVVGQLFTFLSFLVNSLTSHPSAAVLLTSITFIDAGHGAKIFPPWRGTVGWAEGGQQRWAVTKNPGYLLYEGDYTTQLYRDYNKPL